MRSEEDRIQRLHRRTAQLKRQRRRHQLAGLGSASAFLMVLLAALLLQTNELSPSIPEGGYTGSSLLGESAGGYVLAAVIAFSVGVIITALVFRVRRR